jgi:hypothetical protein
MAQGPLVLLSRRDYYCNCHYSCECVTPREKVSSFSQHQDIDEVVAAIQNSCSCIDPDDGDGVFIVMPCTTPVSVLTAGVDGKLLFFSNPSGEFCIYWLACDDTPAPEEIQPRLQAWFDQRRAQRAEEERQRQAEIKAKAITTWRAQVDRDYGIMLPLVGDGPDCQAILEELIRDSAKWRNDRLRECSYPDELLSPLPDDSIWQEKLRYLVDRHEIKDLHSRFMQSEKCLKLRRDIVDFCLEKGVTSDKLQPIVDQVATPEEKELARGGIPYQILVLFKHMSPQEAGMRVAELYRQRQAALYEQGLK